MKRTSMKNTLNKRSTIGLRQGLDKELWEAMSREARIEGLTVSDIFSAIIESNMDKLIINPPPDYLQYRTMSISKSTSKRLSDLAKKHKVKKAEIVRQIIEIALRK